MTGMNANAAIFSPMMATMFLTFVVWVYMYARRIPFIKTLDLPSDELTPAALAELSPPSVANPSDNLKNLFEVPVLFYALCLYLYATNQVDTLYVAAAWIFVGFRYLHSAMHCTKNIVIVRFGLYFAASAAFFFMFFRAAINMLTG
jgi:hypothetical protein